MALLQEAIISVQTEKCKDNIRQDTKRGCLKCEIIAFETAPLLYLLNFHQATGIPSTYLQ